jgi:casein kinase 1
LKREGQTDDGQYDWMYINNGKGWEASAVYPSVPD